MGPGILSLRFAKFCKYKVSLPYRFTLCKVKDKDIVKCFKSALLLCFSTIY